MRKLFKALVALALCSIMLVCSVAGGSADFLDGFSVKSSASANYLGDYIWYGTYPQSEVKDETLIAALDSVESNWISYRYFSGSGKTSDGQMKPSDYMYYKDVVYDGNKYRAVTFDKYRPCSTAYNNSSEYTYQINNGYEINTVYWFKFEPVKWHILDESSGLIMADIILDAQPYNNFCIRDSSIEDRTYSYFGDEEQTYFVSDYSNSDIRQWLNNDFYNTAFSEENKENIISTELNNDSTVPPQMTISFFFHIPMLSTRITALLKICKALILKDCSKAPTMQKRRDYMYSIIPKRIITDFHPGICVHPEFVPM